MATILEEAVWTVTEEVADHMVETGLLMKCERDHNGMLAVDKPIYHIACTAPKWLGFATLTGAIIGAEKAVEELKTNEKATK